MFDNSAYYGLSNPAFTKDIGYGMIDMMYPSAGIDPVSGTVDIQPADVPPLVNNGQPNSDTFQSEGKSKKGKTVRNVLIGLGVAALAALGFYKFKTPIMNAAGKVTTPVKNFFTSLMNKFKKPSP